MEALKAFYLVFLCCFLFVLVCWYPRKPLKVEFVSQELTVILNVKNVSVLKSLLGNEGMPVPFSMKKNPSNFCAGKLFK